MLITGVCGTIGKELLHQILEYEPAEVIGLDNNESELFFLTIMYKEKKNVHLFLGDIRDPSKLERKFKGVDIVFHTAAYKHVELCEQAPRDAVQTNIIGTQNVIDAALANSVGKVIFTSSDKAVNPTNVMGTSKLMGERLMTAANAVLRGAGTIFTSTRFGNVLGSRGSVIPLFKKQIADGGPVTLTDPAMTRFIMTLNKAVLLVVESSVMARGGEVFITKMPIIRIKDLAELMIEELAPTYGFSPEEISLEVTGAKPGEKLYEELINDEEVRRTVELDNFFAVQPAFKNIYQDVDIEYYEKRNKKIEHCYNSSVEPAMEKEGLRVYIRENGLLEE